VKKIKYGPSDHNYKEKSIFHVHSINDVCDRPHTSFIKLMNLKSDFLHIIVTGWCISHILDIFSLYITNKYQLK